MKLHKIILLSLLLLTNLFSYVDNDIDGVDDAVDLCPDTSFDDLVDETGCPENKGYRGILTLQLGSSINYDEFSSKNTDYDFFANYQYHHWDISLSNSQQTTYDNNNNASSSTGDVYLYGGYTIDKEELQTTLSLGTKIATANTDIGTGENDYFGSLNLNYILTEKSNLFSYLSYTFVGDSSDYNYKNSLTSSIGAGYLFYNKLYASLSYDYGTSIYEETNAYRAISLFTSYSFLDDYFMTLSYSHGLDDLSYTHSYAFMLGVTFD